MNAIIILYVVSAIFMILFIVTKNKPEKKIARKTWLRISVIFAIVATFNWILIS